MTINIRNLINEELDMLHKVEYQDVDIIDSSRLSLDDEYNKINKQLFGGQLPKIPMRWSNRKRNLGHVRAFVNRMTKEYKIRYLAISSFHAMPYRVFKDTLAHEMIHVKQLSYGLPNYDPSSPHGRSFMGEADRINAMGLGYKITVRSEEKMDMSDKAKENTRALVAIILHIDGRNTLSVTTPNVFASDADYLFNTFEHLVQRGKYRKVEIMAVESRNPQLLKYRVQRTYKKGVAHGPMSDELLNDLLSSKLIKRVIFETGKVKYMSETDNDNNAGNWEEITIV
jgi:hypothetical protein